MGLYQRLMGPRDLFLIIVVAAAVVPRMPFDTPFSIGGNLSNSFRKLLFLVYALHVFRLELFQNSFAMRGLESTLLTVLSLLMPYLLRLWLIDYINLPGGRRPGRSLQAWVFAFAGLTTLSVVLVTQTGHNDLWIFKKIGDVLTFIPVYRTLKWYNSVTTAQSNKYPGRGNVLAQFVMVGECYSVIANILDVITKLLKLLGLTSEDVVSRLGERNFYALYTRVLFHSILLNVLDESYHIASTSSHSAPQAASGSPSSSTKPSDDLVMTLV